MQANFHGHPKRDTVIFSSCNKAGPSRHDQTTKSHCFKILNREKWISYALSTQLINSRSDFLKRHSGIDNHYVDIIIINNLPGRENKLQDKLNLLASNETSGL